LLDVDSGLRAVETVLIISVENKLIYHIPKQHYSKNNTLILPPPSSAGFPHLLRRLLTSNTLVKIKKNPLASHRLR